MAVKMFWSALLGRKSWGYDARIKGRRVHKIGFASKENAELALSKRRIAANEKRAGVTPEAARITVAHLVTARINQFDKKSYSQKHSGVTLRAWAAMMPDALLVEEVKTAHLAKYRDARLQKIKPQSVHRELADIYACLNAASELFTELAEWRPPKRPRLKVPKGYRNVTIEPVQIALILTRLRREKEEKERITFYRARMDAADFFQIALYTLARKDEIRTLRWDAISWQAHKLQLDSKKTDTDAAIFIPDALIELFKRRRDAQHPASPFVFPSSRNPQRPVSRFCIEIVKRAAEKCGIPWGYDQPNGIVFHTTRHTAVTALLDAGYDLATVKAQSRHSTSQMLLRYSHPSVHNRRAAADTLSSFLPEPPAPNSDAGLLEAIANDDGLVN